RKEIVPDDGGQTHLPSPSLTQSTQSFTDAESDESDDLLQFSTPTQQSPYAQASSSTAPPPSKKQVKPRIIKGMDVTKILSPGAKRQRSKADKKATYTAAVAITASGALNSYHASFSVLAAARNY
ncbi:MAG: hypothetical protein Q9203_007747, partial [Teloschistes exilis]